MKSQTLLIMVTLLLLLVCSTGLAGCASSRVVLHPIDKQDIVRMRQGVPHTPDRDGHFLSDYYFKRVLEATIEEK
jgi:hypothetical protein